MTYSKNDNTLSAMLQIREILSIGCYMSRKSGQLYIGAGILRNQIAETIVVVLFIVVSDQRHVIFANATDVGINESRNRTISHVRRLSISHLLYSSNKQKSIRTLYLCAIIAYNIPSRARIIYKSTKRYRLAVILKDTKIRIKQNDHLRLIIIIVIIIRRVHRDDRL